MWARVPYDECDRPARKGSAAWTLAQARRDGEVEAVLKKLGVFIVPS